ncbi:Glycerophosphodiester phosphodiesterase GDPDL4 [Spatholobus suberectus]|nr:Glycerophosphodiester phosphodiesterase GDPDL4 [Spatholobus suberectus]
MWKPRALSAPLAVLLLHTLLALVSAQRSVWNTLNGGTPVVVARGGFSGIFPIPVLGVYSRSNLFDGLGFPILTIEDLVTLNQKPKGIWLNIQHDAFYTQHNLSMRKVVLSASKSIVFSYISSPEVGFLRSITTRFNPKKTKLVFRFMDVGDTEPSTNQTYDAHNAGLEVFASDFVNDVPSSFNYSYDPLTEYLQFIDNGDFSVDGVLSDFPITPFEAIGCFAHLGTNATKTGKTLIISKYGASGDYPACTDLAYKQAISDGVDVLDCPVQMSKEGTPFCLNSIDLIESTTVAQSSFSKFAMTIPEIKSGSGIFAFNLTWNEIKDLTPSILNPFAKYRLFRNPKNKNAGKLVRLSDFLSLTQNQTSLSGVVIIVETAGYDKPGPQKVYIQSTNSSVLLNFKEKTSYELVYKIDENVGDAANAAVKDIKSFASSVIVSKDSVFSSNSKFLTGSTKIVPKLKAANLSVFVETFSNEFVSQAWDFFSDATVEINSYIQEATIDGIITDFPKTADRYRRNKCLNLGNNTPPYMESVQPGGLYSLITKDYLPPAAAPLPPLTESEVTEPPVPSVAKIAPASSPSAESSAPPGNAQPKVAVWFFVHSGCVYSFSSSALSKIISKLPSKEKEKMLLLPVSTVYFPNSSRIEWHEAFGFRLHEQSTFFVLKRGKFFQSYLL